MDDYGYVLLGVSAVVFVGGMVFFWAVSRWAPKGTLLAIAVVLYAASWGINGIRAREIVLVAGLMRMLGFVGGILGLFDLFRKRPEPPVIAEIVEPPSITQEPRNHSSGSEGQPS